LAVYCLAVAIKGSIWGDSPHRSGNLIHARSFQAKGRTKMPSPAAGHECCRPSVPAASYLACWTEPAALATATDDASPTSNSHICV